ncbi:MAG: hypothetical protein Alis3KO_00910 [Aliiglaciecola sp.]
MKLFAQAQEILAQTPLPDDAPAQLDTLLEQAAGQEAVFILMAMEGLHASASDAQLQAWSGQDDS